MPRDSNIKKVLVIGSGPIIIGQAAEFDYAGTQACRALREEGISVVLINSNPATIMTDTEIADRVYIEPLNVEFAERIIARERPDGLLPTLGGQTGLNLATQLAEAGILQKYDVKLLGTPLDSIRKAEDREAFRTLMHEINEPVPESWIITDETQLDEPLASHIWPLIVRPAYTLGGTGGGIAYNADELLEITRRGLEASMRHQVMVERYLAGWKEIEYEVMRDANDTAITVCNMENFDPMGVHTGDSIVVAPSQTLSDKEYQMLRSAALKIIRALKIEGGCNVQMSLDPNSFRYYIIEVNPRVSRSSALASKATGYPIARVAAKIATGLYLDEIENAVTKKTLACFEPALDYCVVKIPRWPFDKFSLADRRIGTQMKATGEVMAIDRSFESALMKAIRSLEVGIYGLSNKTAHQLSDIQLEEAIRTPNDERLWAITEGLRRGLMVEEIFSLSSIDPWFLRKLQDLVGLETRLRISGTAMARLAALNDDELKVHREPGGEADTEQVRTIELLRSAKRRGFPDRVIAEFAGVADMQIRKLRKRLDIVPVFKIVDTCAAEFEAATPYFYSCYDSEDETSGQLESSADAKKVVVIGSGPIRIGQGIEFDYCSVHCVWALREAGYQAIIINNNPETVSTDFDTSDRLFFEPLTPEDVLNILDRECPEGVVVQFGGQTAINLAKPLSEAGIRIFGSSFESIDLAEDRDRFEKVLSELGIPKPDGRAVTSAEGALEVAQQIGYPVLVRPSYVLGGRAMEIVYNRDDLERYMAYVVDVSPKSPILVDKYILGKEVEVDVIGDGTDCLLPGIMEHIERAGVHSGDSMAVYPPQTLRREVINQIVETATLLARRLEVRGLMNIQFVVDRETNTAQVLEVNPRASRTVPYLSKITGIPMVRVATHIMLGKSIRDQGFVPGLHPDQGSIAVKAPVFSFTKLGQVDIGLGPEMKSTGEVMGLDTDYSRALYKAMIASGIGVPDRGGLIVTVADSDKEEVVPIIREFAALGFKVFGTVGTAQFLQSKGIDVQPVNKLHEGEGNIVDLIKSGTTAVLINTLSSNKRIEREGAHIRRASVEAGVPCLTSLDTARALLMSIAAHRQGDPYALATVDEYLGGVVH